MGNLILKPIVCATLMAALCPVCLGADTSHKHFQRDPFRRPQQSIAPTDQKTFDDDTWTPDLRAIIYDKQQPLINIDGQIVGIGDSIGGYRVMKVEERSALLVKNSKRLKIKLDRTSSR